MVLNKIIRDTFLFISIFEQNFNTKRKGKKRKRKELRFCKMKIVTLHGAGGTGQCHQMSHGGSGGLKSVKKVSRSV